MPQPQRVFISYSHDDDAHVAAVLALAQRLRADGVDAWLDRFEPAPAEGWPRWMIRQIQEADQVLMVITETYAQRLGGLEAPGRGLGVQWEGLLILQSLYEQGGKNERMIPVKLGEWGPDDVPLILRPWTRYALDRDYGTLLRRLGGPGPGDMTVRPAPLRSAGTVMPEEAGGREAALVALLVGLFSAEELRQHLAGQARLRPLVPELPGESVSLTKLAFDTVELLARHGLVDGGFFDGLIRRRAARRAEITRVAEAWALVLGAAPPSAPRPSEGNAVALARAVEDAIAQARGAVVDRVVRASASGAYVALQAPAGFGLSAALREVTLRLRALTDTAVLYLSPFPAAGQIERWVEHVSFLGRRVGLEVAEGQAEGFWDLFHAIRSFTGTSPTCRLTLVLDDFEAFPVAHQRAYVELLGYLARIWEDRFNLPELERVSVVMGGGRSIDAILTGRIPGAQRMLSPFRADVCMLGAVSDPGVPGSRELWGRVGGHPELLRWALGHPSEEALPEADLPWLREEMRRSGSLEGRREMEALERHGRLPAGCELAELRWSGLVDPLEPWSGWLGRIQEKVARRILGER